MLASFSGKTPACSVQRPPSRALCDQRREERPAHASAARAFGDVDALLADAAVDGAARVRDDRDPPGDLAVDLGDEAVLGQVSGVPVLPRRHRRLEGGVARRDALREDRGDGGPVGGEQRADRSRRDSIASDGRGERLRRRVDRRHGRAGVPQPRAAARGDARRAEARRHDLPDRARPAQLSLSLALRRRGVDARARGDGDAQDAGGRARARARRHRRVSDRTRRRARRSRQRARKRAC